MHLTVHNTAHDKYLSLPIETPGWLLTEESKVVTPGVIPEGLVTGSNFGWLRCDPWATVNLMAVIGTSVVSASRYKLTA